ncbi:50S ribosomal protein L15e [Candidatus Pacearchaeota archaeon]|nr:50S ribosomal protein L15e [Candidatus Pacearchaeota archaeon]|tara:strand:- start:463 stop:1032 length:570 start_codon:yes stop_codon:yes gene_type:complete
MKGLTHHLRAAWKKPDVARIRELMVEWRKQKVVEKIDKPTRLDRARSLGYKAKKGFVLARVRVLRGGRKRPKPNKGRRSKRTTNKKVLKMSYKWIAEGRASNKFPNLEVLNSYYLAKDGKHYFYEVILLDASRPEIKSDKNVKFITKPTNKNRTQRGLTSAGKKSRGLRSKNPMNKSRPSVRAGKRRGK